MKYKEIRNEYQNHNYLEMQLVDIYAMFLSPILTKVFLKLNVIPNYITIMMMISGIIGACLFAIPNIAFKILGLLFIHLWYILDCSDGEVARITKKFSKFGKEIDFTAHIINHPLFNIAFALSLLSENKYNTFLIMMLFMIYISTDLASRNLLTFETIFDLKIKNDDKNYNPSSLLKRIAIFSTRAVTLYPNFALIFPIVYIIDYATKSNLCLFYLIIVTALNVILVSRSCYKWVRTIKDL